MLLGKNIQRDNRNKKKQLRNIWVNVKGNIFKNILFENLLFLAHLNSYILLTNGYLESIILGHVEVRPDR